MAALLLVLSLIVLDEFASARPRRRSDRIRVLFAAVHRSANGRLCCKSRKLQGDEFFAKTRNGKHSPIRMTSIALPKSPVSLT